MAHSRILYAPEARRALNRGFNKMAAAMRVALGPRGRLVAVNRGNPRKPPELLNDGAAIARRFLGLPNRFETMGAFLARHIAWQVEKAVGDGTTTAVVIAQQILNEADRYIAAGHNGMALRRGMEKGLAAVQAELASLARPLEDPRQVTALAAGITGSEELGRYIEEIFDTVGPHGAVEVRNSYARVHDRRYIRGVMWNNGWISSYFCTEGGKALLHDPYLLFTNRHLSSAAELAPIMEKVRNSGGGKRGLVVIATSVESDALNMLVTNKSRGVLPTLAIKAPGLGTEKAEVLEDLAALCGGRVFLEVTGDRLEKATLDDLGQADEVQAIRSSFTVVGGKGRPADVRRRADELRHQLPKASYGRDRDRLLERSGKLMGGVGLLQIGGASDVERDHMKERAEEAVRIVRIGLLDGVVPGGGAAFLAAAAALDHLDLPDDEVAALPILRGALEAPTRAIIANAGLEPNPILARLRESAPGCGFDVVQETFVDMADTAIVDPVRVLQAALETGVSGALMALTTDVLVHRPRHNRDEDVSFDP
jgi:chaperonin GroEL